MGRRSDSLQITPAILLKAYSCGIFPMAEDAEDPSIHWIDPSFRGVIPLAGFHAPRSLVKAIRRQPFEITADKAFPAVVDGCAEPKPGREQTWINREIRELYLQLFLTGHAHSIEAWKDGQLVGGLYGVSLGGAFFGESMFSRETDASKISLAYLWDRLRRGGYKLLDTQFLTAHLTRFGAVEIPRAEYHILLAEALDTETTFYPAGGGTADSVLQSLSQTS